MSDFQLAKFVAVQVKQALDTLITFTEQTCRTFEDPRLISTSKQICTELKSLSSKMAKESEAIRSVFFFILYSILQRS